MSPKFAFSPDADEGVACPPQHSLCGICFAQADNEPGVLSEYIGAVSIISSVLRSNYSYIANNLSFSNWQHN